MFDVVDADPAPRDLIGGISAGLTDGGPVDPASLVLSVDELSLLDRTGDGFCVELFVTAVFVVVVCCG